MGTAGQDPCPRCILLPRPRVAVYRCASRCRAIDVPWTVIGCRCSNPSRRPSAGKTCLSLTSRAISSKATETPLTGKACP
jgi:hypothetical protein